MNLIDTLREYTGKCINCSFCEAVCPTFQAFEYSSSYGARGRIFLAREISVNKNIINNVRDFFYSCLNCNVCESVCPAGISAGKASLMVKRIISSENEMDYIVNALVKMIMENRSPVGKMDGPSWYDISMKNGSDILFYSGGIYSLMAHAKMLSNIIRNRKMKEIAERILKKNPDIIFLFSNFEDKGLMKRMDTILYKIFYIIKTVYKDVNYLGYMEPYSGALLYEFGYYDEMIEYGNFLRDFFNSLKIKKIITSDPHTHEMMKKIYPENIQGFNFESEFYLDSFRADLKNNGRKYAYHEPCHFSTHLRVDSPLNILKSIGDVSLPARNGRTTYCCGGPIEMLFPSKSERISEIRYGQLRDLETDEIVTSCPVCLSNLEKYGKIRDISEIIFENIIH